MGIVRTILIILLVYYGFKFLTRLLAPIILKKMVNKMGSNFQSSFTNFSKQAHSQKKEGDITIEKPTKKNKNTKSKKDVGSWMRTEVSISTAVLLIIAPSKLTLKNTTSLHITWLLILLPTRFDRVHV